MLGYHPFYCGDYLLYDSDCYPYGPGLFAVMGDEILTMDEAYDNRIFPTLDPVMGICFFDVQIKLGDYNKDGKIGMIDVLALQKYITRVIEPPYENPLPGRELIFDFDKNYTVNLSDVLAMQKKIAKVA